MTHRNTKSGFSLVEVVVAAALLSGVAMGVMHLSKIGLKIMTSSNNFSKSITKVAQFEALIADSETCTKIFAGVQMNKNNLNLSIDGEPLIKKGEVFSNNITVEDLSLKSIGLLNNNLSEQVLEVQFSNKDGKTFFKRDLHFFAKTDSSKIVSCFSSFSESSSMEMACKYLGGTYETSTKRCNLDVYSNPSTDKLLPVGQITDNLKSSLCALNKMIVHKDTGRTNDNICSTRYHRYKLNKDAHYHDECTRAGGVVFGTPTDYSSGHNGGFCLFASSSCPASWAQYLSWTETSSNNCNINIVGSADPESLDDPDKLMKYRCNYGTSLAENTNIFSGEHSLANHPQEEKKVYNCEWTVEELWDGVTTKDSSVCAQWAYNKVKFPSIFVDSGFGSAIGAPIIKFIKCVVSPLIGAGKSSSCSGSATCVKYEQENVLFKYSTLSETGNVKSCKSTIQKIGCY